jgi:hypothetical protein
VFNNNLFCFLSTQFNKSCLLFFKFITAARELFHIFIIVFSNYICLCSSNSIWKLFQAIYITEENLLLFLALHNYFGPLRGRIMKIKTINSTNKKYEICENTSKAEVRLIG